MFTDETIVSQHRSYQPHVRRPRGERFNASYTSSSVRSAPKRMIWGGISASGRCGLHVFGKTETVKATNYLEILKERAEPFMNIRGTRFLQQDGALAHKSRLASNWIALQNFQLLEGWPGNSPDLNCIENCWSALKNKLQRCHISSNNTLVEHVTRLWVTEVTPAYCRKLVESMPQRIQACLTAKDITQNIDVPFFIRTLSKIEYFQCC